MIPSVATCFSLNPYALRKWSSSASADLTNGLDATTGGASLRAALSASCAAHPPAGIGPCSFALQCKTPTAPFRERWALAECSDAPTYSDDGRRARPAHVAMQSPGQRGGARQRHPYIMTRPWSSQSEATTRSPSPPRRSRSERDCASRASGRSAPLRLGTPCLGGFCYRASATAGREGQRRRGRSSIQYSGARQPANHAPDKRADARHPHEHSRPGSPPAVGPIRQVLRGANRSGHNSEPARNDKCPQRHADQSAPDHPATSPRNDCRMASMAPALMTGTSGNGTVVSLSVSGL